MPTKPARIIAIDWSGAQSPVEQRRRIVTADWHNDTVTVTSGRTRDDVTAWLIEQSQQTPSMLAGLDFSFSFPAWFVQHCGANSIQEFWAIAAANAEQWLRTCEAPFWGRPGKRCPATHRGPDWLGYRACERAIKMHRHPSSTFQIGGAGAVGTGSLRGMQTLLALREAGFSIWPFDKPTLPYVVEIYPRLFTGPVVKSSAAERASYLRHLHDDFPAAALDAAVLHAASESEDAFDALCSVIGMARQRDHFAKMRQATGPVTLLEGSIFPGRPIR